MDTSSDPEKIKLGVNCNESSVAGISTFPPLRRSTGGTVASRPLPVPLESLFMSAVNVVVAGSGIDAGMFFLLKGHKKEDRIM